MKNQLIKTVLYQKGFTLMETLVAIAVLVMAVTGPMTIAQTGLSASRYAKDALTASLLAGEAIEYIRNERDSNYIQGNGNWLAGSLMGYVNSGQVFDIDVVQDRFINCSTVCEPLNFNSTNQFYSHMSGTPSPFSRSITLSRISDSEVRVHVRIDWTMGLVPKQYELTEHIYDWRL